MIHLCQQCFDRCLVSAVFVIEKVGNAKIYRRGMMLATHAYSRLSRPTEANSVNEVGKTRLGSRKALR